MTPKRAACNSTYKKLAVQCSADTFGVAESFVLRMNICGKNRQLLVAAKRYRQVVNTIQITTNKLSFFPQLTLFVIGIFANLNIIRKIAIINFKSDGITLNTAQIL